MAMRCTLPTPGPALEVATNVAARVPVLESNVLRLRAMALSDFDTFAEIATSPRGQFFSEAKTASEAWYEFATLAAGWALHGHGCWTIETKRGDVAGFVLIGLEPGDLEPELGFMLADAFEAQSIAYDAGTLALAYAKDTLRLPTLVSYIDPANPRSIALAKRLGGTQDGMVQECHVYRYAMGADTRQCSQWIYRSSKPNACACASPAPATCQP